VSTPSPAADAPGGDTSPRNRLLQAARDVVADEGLEGLTLRAIARRAGVSHGAPLRHFPSLAALLTAVATDGFSRLVATVDDDLARAEADADEGGGAVGPRDRLRIAGRAYVRFALENPGVFSVTFRPERVDVGDPDYQRWGAASFGQLVGLVEAAQADGWHADEDSVDLAAVLWAQVHGIAELGLHGGLVAVGTGRVVDRPRRDAGGGTAVPGGRDEASVVMHLADLATRLSLTPRPQPPPAAAPAHRHDHEGDHR
jgi:AcrR family transcriptional regulator